MHIRTNYLIGQHDTVIDVKQVYQNPSIAHDTVNVIKRTNDTVKNFIMFDTKTILNYSE